ncbi:hypothetical protein Tco_0064686 [Tanacetum coccineum]
MYSTLGLLIASIWLSSKVNVNVPNTELMSLTPDFEKSFKGKMRPCILLSLFCAGLTAPAMTAEFSALALGTTI